MNGPATANLRPDTTEAIPAARLAALVASRLCHDLVSPLGAIGNGIELLELTAPEGLAGSPEMSLIAESMAAARARIATFRVAFGQAGAEARMSRAEIDAGLRDLAAGGRLTVELDAPGDAARGEVKMVLLALMCLETAMPWGGRVLVCRAGTVWRLVAEAARTKSDPALWSWLSPERAGVPRPAPQPSEVQFPLLAAEAVLQDRALRWEIDEQGGEIAF